MEPNLFLVLSACLFFITLVGIAWRFSSGLTDFVMLFVLVFGLFYGFRGLLMTLGLDGPYPDQFFPVETAANDAAVTLLWLTVFLVFTAVGMYLTSELMPTRRTLFFAREEPPTARLVTVTVALTALAAVISVLMIARYGGVGPFIRAVKVEKDLTGLYFLKVPAAIGAICSVATFVQLRNSASGLTRRAAFLVLGCAVLDGFFVFIWGQRSTLVILGVLLILSTLGQRSGRVRPLEAAVGLIAAVAIVIGVSAGLRVARDELVSGEVQSVVADASVWRQASIATNSIYFDSSMLAFRDWPADHEYRLGEDFALSAAGFVPRIVWSGKPQTVVAGKWFRQVYQPKIINGWPVGAPTLWWLNFGPLGVALGGLITGIVFGWIRRAQLNSARSPLNVATAVVTAVYVFQTGVGPQWPVYFMSWLLPLWLVVWFVTRRPGVRADDDDGPAAGDAAVAVSPGGGGATRYAG